MAACTAFVEVLCRNRPIRLTENSTYFSISLLDDFMSSSKAAAHPTVDWFRVMPFLAMHVACLSVLWVGWSWTSVEIAVLLFFARVFGLTAFYHRYFSHRAFKTSRWFQFAGAWLGCSACQRGPI